MKQEQEQNKKNTKNSEYGYKERSAVSWILIYVILGVILYGVIYFLWLR